MENKNKMLQELIYDSLELTPEYNRDRYVHDKIFKNVLDNMVKDLEKTEKNVKDINEHYKYLFVLSFANEIRTQRSYEEILGLRIKLESILFSDLVNGSKVSASQLGMYSALGYRVDSIHRGLEFLSKMEKISCLGT